MEEKLKKIANWIKENYNGLPKSKIDGKELVIFATGDFSGEYGYVSSDLESWGVDKDGKLFWAYASGCSCGCGAGTEEKSFKVFEVEKVNIDDTNLFKMIGMFEVDIQQFQKSIGSYEYESY